MLSWPALGKRGQEFLYSPDTMLSERSTFTLLHMRMGPSRTVLQRTYRVRCDVSDTKDFTAMYVGAERVGREGLAQVIQVSLHQSSLSPCRFGPT